MMPEWLKDVGEKRKLFYQRDLDSVLEHDYTHEQAVPDMVETHDEANLISSWLGDGFHAPALDLDIPHQYVPSSTEGHGHLFLDVELTPKQYRKLLDVLLECGIIQKGFHAQFKRCGATFLRTRKKGVPPPAVKQKEGDQSNKHLEQYYTELNEFFKQLGPHTDGLQTLGKEV